MNTLYSHASKQRRQLETDLGRFEQELAAAPISLQGSLAATLVSWEKTIAQYKDQLAAYKASSPAGDHDGAVSKHQDKYDALVASHKELSEKFKELKRQYNEANGRTRLFPSKNTSGNPFEEGPVMNKRNVAASGAGERLSGSDYATAGLPLHEGLQREQSIFQRGNAQLDLLLEMGHQSLDDIVEQNQIILKMQDHMSKSLRTLGVSDATIQQINRRVFKDKLIFWVALALLFVGMYYVLKWFR